MKMPISIKQQGFTLLELLLVISIVGILTSVGVARYQTYILDANRYQAVANLQMAQQAMERQFLRNSSYTELSAEQLRVFSSESHNMSAAVSSTGNTYTLSSSPTLNFPDSKCGILSITESGLKEHSGTTKSISECWGQ